MKVYGVVQRYYSSGRFKTIIREIEWTRKSFPVASSVTNKAFDEWIDYFSTFEEAKLYADQVEIDC